MAAQYFEITHANFSLEIKSCSGSAHILLPAKLRGKNISVNYDIKDKSRHKIESKTFNGIPPICGSACHIKLSKHLVGKIAKGIITILDN